MKYNMIVCNFEKGLISFGACHAVGTPASCWVSSVRVGSERYVQLKRTMLCSCHCLMFVCQLLMHFSFQTILYISIIYDGPLMHAATRWLIHCLFIWHFLIFQLWLHLFWGPTALTARRSKQQNYFNIYDNYIIKIITYFIISQLYRFISMLQIYRYKYTTYPYIIASKYKSYNIIYI